MTRHIGKAQLFASLPPVWPEDSRPAIRAAVAAHQGTPGKRAVFFDKAQTQGVQVELTGTETLRNEN